LARVVTSIRVEEELWKEFKIKAIREGKGVSHLLEELLRKELRKGGN